MTTAPTGALDEFRAAVQRLSSAQKSSRGAPAYSRYVNRPVGRVFAAIAHVLGATPTQVTLVSGLFTASGIVCLALLTPSIPSSILVSLLLVIGYALDSADGQLARLSGTSSLAGEWLDHFFDAIKAATLHVAVLICWWKHFDLPNSALLVPLGFGVVASVFFFGVASADLLRRIHRERVERVGGAQVPDTRTTGTAYSLAVLPADYGLMCVLFLISFWKVGFITVYSVVFALNLLLLIASGLRWYRSINQLSKDVDA